MGPIFTKFVQYQISWKSYKRLNLSHQAKEGRTEVVSGKGLFFYFVNDAWSDKTDVWVNGVLKNMKFIKLVSVN